MKIVTDCAADMLIKEREELDIVEAPLYIQFPEGEVISSEITADEFYDRLEAMRPNIPTTSLPSEGVFADIFNKLAETSKQIMTLHISSGLSGTFNSAKNGASQVKTAEVTAVDTMTLSGGERFQVLAAAWAARAGWSKDAILERLSQIRESTEVIYTLETLEYLARGGRIGRVQALAGSLLKLKPVIRVDRADGKYSTVGKNRTIQKSLSNITDHIVEMYGQIPVWVTVLHGRLSESADVLAKLLGENLNIKKLEILRISPVLGVHTGPGIVGVAVLPMNLVEDLQ
jgi:DegV family protein with EDD domain